MGFTRSRKAQAALEFLMSYGWLVLIIIIAGAALYSAGILRPGTYQKTGCIGFERLQYRDHVFRATGTTGIWDITQDNDDADDRDSEFRLRFQNGVGATIHVQGMNVEYPEGIHVVWSERGYGCDYTNTPNDESSGCREQNVSEGEVTTLSIEDVGFGTVDLITGIAYRAKVKVTFDVFNALGDHSEMAICAGKIEGILAAETIRLSVAGSPVTEDGGQATVTARLSGHNDLDVPVHFTISGTAVDGTDFTVDAYEVTIPAGELERSITITSIHDRIDENDETVVVEISLVTNIAGDQEGQPITVTIADDDSSGIVTSGTPDISETGTTTGTYQVKLNSNPTSSVTVSLAENFAHHDQLTITSPASGQLSFTGGSGGDWDSYQTVTVQAVDDDYDEATDVHSGPILHTAASSDPRYDGQQREINAVVRDNDVSGVTITESAGTTIVAEGGAGDTYTVVLTSKPYYGVGITIIDDVELQDMAALSFADVNWDQAQTVTVSAQDDSADEEDTHPGTVSHSVTSTDSKYNIITPASVSVTVVDDDPLPDLTLSGTTSISESGGSTLLTASYTGTASEREVTVNLGFSGTATPTDDYTRSITDIVIPAGSQSGTVTISSAHDTDDENDETVVVDISSVTNGQESAPQQATVTIQDDDAPAVTLQLSASSIAEDAAGTVTVSATANKAPADDITITIGFTGDASNPADYTTTGTSLTILAGQTTSDTVTIDPVDDPNDEANEGVIVDITGVSPAEHGIESGTQQRILEIIDDDVSVITLGLSGSPLAENGGTATVSATADIPPAAQVTISLAFSGTATLTSDYTRSGTSLTINSGQTASSSVTLTGVNDDIDDDAETIIVDIGSVTPSAHGAESGTQQRTATITDDPNDVAGITVSVSDNLATEGGDPAAFTIVLDTRPTGSVSISISDDAQVDASPTSVTFTTGNWNSARTVTVTTVDDGVEEGAHTGQVTNAAASSSDGNYNGMAVDDVTVSITDNDP